MVLEVVFCDAEEVAIQVGDCSLTSLCIVAQMLSNWKQIKIKSTEQCIRAVVAQITIIDSYRQLYRRQEVIGTCRYDD